MVRFSDEELLESVRDIDVLSASVSSWEADFIESVLERDEAHFSPKQRDVITRMMEKYLS